MQTTINEKKEFMVCVENVLKRENYPTFEINNPGVLGVVVNEYDVIQDFEVMIPNTMITSNSFNIDFKTAEEILDELGIIYPEVIDFNE